MLRWRATASKARNEFSGGKRRLIRSVWMARHTPSFKFFLKTGLNSLNRRPAGRRLTQGLFCRCGGNGMANDTDGALGRRPRVRRVEREAGECEAANQVPEHGR